MGVKVKLALECAVMMLLLLSLVFLSSGSAFRPQNLFGSSNSILWDCLSARKPVFLCVSSWISFQLRMLLKNASGLSWREIEEKTGEENLL